MKRFLTLLAVISMTITAMAQHPMATLSRNGELTQFTGMHALDDVLNASMVGDIIYLSEGTFSSDGGGIQYGINVIGSGYNTKILGSWGVRMTDDNRDITMDTPWLDGVNVEKLRFRDEGEFDANRKFLEVKNCWIGELDYAGHAAKNFYINGCFIENANFSGTSEFPWGQTDTEKRNIYLNNSKIKYLGRDSQFVMTTNCNIKKAENCPRIVKSCIIEESTAENGKLFTWSNGTHMIDNSLFPSNEFVSSEYDNDRPSDGTIITNCYFENPANGLLDENLNCTIDLQAKGYLGEDGTIIGAYGGENPFSEYPSVPTIDSSKSSVEFDQAGNKLNVTISVAGN